MHARHGLRSWRAGYPITSTITIHYLPSPSEPTTYALPGVFGKKGALTCLPSPSPQKQFNAFRQKGSSLLSSANSPMRASNFRSVCPESSQGGSLPASISCGPSPCCPQACERSHRTTCSCCSVVAGAPSQPGNGAKEPIYSTLPAPRQSSAGTDNPYPCVWPSVSAEFFSTRIVTSKPSMPANPVLRTPSSAGCVEPAPSSPRWRGWRGLPDMLKVSFSALAWSPLVKVPLACALRCACDSQMMA